MYLNNRIELRTSLLILLIIIAGFGEASGQIQCEDYHSIRGDFKNSYATFSKKKKGRVAFLGGSITFNPGWRDSISTYIQNKFADTKFDFIAAGIPSMGSTPGAFRLYRDILSKGKVDLLFVEAAVNDPTNGRTSTEQIRGMEGIIRHAKKVNPRMDIIIMYFVDPDKMKCYNNGQIPEVIINHEKVAVHYQVSSINLAKEVTDRINAGEFSWEQDFKDLHPSLFGQMVYYRSIKTFLANGWDIPANSDYRPVKYPLPEKIDAFSYDQGKLIAIEKAEMSNDWEIIPDWNPGPGENTRKGYVNVPMLAADTPGAECELKFKGKAIGIAVAAGPDAGMIEYSIDGGSFEKIDLFTRWSSQLHLPWYYVLNSELDSGKHNLVLRISHENNPDSKGHACRIKHFFINE